MVPTVHPSGAKETTRRLSKAFSLSAHDAVAFTLDLLHMRNNQKGSKRHRKQSCPKIWKQNASEHDQTGSFLLPLEVPPPECSHPQRSCKWNIGQDESACLQFASGLPYPNQTNEGIPKMDGLFMENPIINGWWLGVPLWIGNLQIQKNYGLIDLVGWCSGSMIHTEWDCSGDTVGIDKIHQNTHFGWVWKIRCTRKIDWSKYVQIMINHWILVLLHGFAIF